MRSTIAATRDLISRGETLVTGTERVAFDAALWTCAQNSGTAIVVLTEPPDSHELAELLPQKHLLAWPAKLPKRSTERLALRDRLMGELSDRAFEIQIRKNGNMAELAGRLRERRCPVEKFADRSPAPRPIAIESRPDATSAIKLPNSDDWSYLTHFTREPDGAWPGESRADYLKWLCSPEPYQPRDAFAALCRIGSEKRIRACGRLMPDSAPMVCFTALHPTETAKLRRWRSGLMRWSFTKYGLAIRKSALLKLGARAVQYQSRDEIDAAPIDQRRFMQVSRTQKYDWSAEVEWRIDGDVDLSAIPIGDMLAFVAKESHESSYFSEHFGIATSVLG